MSTIAAANRRRTIRWLAVAAGLAALLGALSFLPPARPPVRAEIGAKVLPDFAADADKVQLVMVTTSEEAYHLVRNDDGWVLAEKGSTEERVTGMYLGAFGRPPSAEELTTCREFVAGKESDAKTWTDLAHALFNVKEFVFVR